MNKTEFNNIISWVVSEGYRNPRISMTGSTVELLAENKTFLALLYRPRSGQYDIHARTKTEGCKFRRWLQEIMQKP